jgi:hypothetical protein
MAKPYLIVTSEKVSKEYLDYLDRQNISWIACVKEHVDLARATEILAEQTRRAVWRRAHTASQSLPVFPDSNHILQNLHYDNSSPVLQYPFEGL